MPGSTECVFAFSELDLDVDFFPVEFDNAIQSFLLAFAGICWHPIDGSIAVQNICGYIIAI